MFDSVLQRGHRPRWQLGSGLVFTALAHAVGAAAVVWWSSFPMRPLVVAPEVKFIGSRPAPAPAPAAALPAAAPAGASPATPKVEKKPEKRSLKRPELVQPTEIPRQRPPEAPEPVPEPTPESVPPEQVSPEPQAAVAGLEGGVQGGAPGGQVGGEVGGVVGAIGGTPAPEVMSFGEGMTRPRALPGNRAPQYTREALEAHIEGVMLVKCVITTDGVLTGCRVLQPLPFMEQAVLEALSSWRFTPVTFQGREVSVDYVIRVRLVIPH